MDNPFLRKLAYGTDLTEGDRAFLLKVSSGARPAPSRTDLISEGDKPEDVHLVMSGYACRYKILPDGRRQIMAIFVPGDVCDLHVQILGHMDHSIGTLSDATVVDIPPAVIGELIANPRINRGLWWMTLVDEGTLREWLVSMGQRGAAEQMAHIFCELHLRLQAVGLAGDDSFDLPGTQEDLADLMGITPVHVNRTLAVLREKGLIEIAGRRLLLRDVERLREVGGFDPNYLHLQDGKGHGRGVGEARMIA
ncbi:Crp/Fnr family transcriptional regulator [Brevundimonas sp.]|uniref:Crp/Fnr family transcriptional regulator n=1 Tax=Brevundimonas sp. TaxID=1871086 RepID=UPI002D51E231|nr:Crp/Fnr family transcriptional regulator [Brevundimonas sp.]HYD26207.1 Crp/Fnr family transcriptional regulator [Brevundimonas sp.]